MKDNWDKKLKEKRQRLGWTQKKMADALDISLRTYESYERGETKPNINFKAKVNNRLTGGEFRTNLQSIRPIISILKNKIPNIEKDDSWYDSSTDYISDLTRSFKNLVYSLSEIMLKEKKMMSSGSIFDFNHKEKISLENQREKLEKEIKESLDNLNLEEIFYEIKKSENINQVDIVLQTKEKLELKTGKNTILSFFSSSKKNSIINDFEKLKKQWAEQQSKIEERDLLVDDISKKMSAINKTVKVFNDSKKKFDESFYESKKRIEKKFGVSFNSITNYETQMNLKAMLESSGLKEGTNFHLNNSKSEYIISFPSSKIYINYNCPLGGFEKLLSSNNSDKKEIENIKVEIADQLINYITEYSYKMTKEKGIRSAHIIFVPNEKFLFLAHEGLSLRNKDKEYASNFAKKNGIILASPNSLYPYLSNWQKLSSESIKHKEMMDRLEKIKKEYSETLENTKKAIEVALETKFEDKFKNYDQARGYNDYSYSSGEYRSEDYYERKEEL